MTDTGSMQGIKPMKSCRSRPSILGGTKDPTFAVGHFCCQMLLDGCIFNCGGLCFGGRGEADRNCRRNKAHASFSYQPQQEGTISAPGRGGIMNVRSVCGFFIRSCRGGSFSIPFREETSPCPMSCEIELPRGVDEVPPNDHRATVCRARQDKPRSSEQSGTMPCSL